MIAPYRGANSSQVRITATLDPLSASVMLASVQAIIYARIPLAHKEWLEARAMEAGISLREALDALITDAMETDVRFQQRPPKVIR